MVSEKMEMDLAKTTAKIMLSIFASGILIIFLYVYENMVLSPKRLRLKLDKQGIRGPSPSFLLGNVPEIKRIQLELQSQATNPNDNLHGVVSIAHNWPSTLLSPLIIWRQQYGPNFTYAMGNLQFLCVTDVEVVKEVSICTSLSLGRPAYLSKEHGPLLGQGIISSSGAIWAHQRKIIAPEFYLDKVKGMVNLILDSTTSMIGSWEREIESAGRIADIEVSNYLRSLSGDIISKACFGSSYLQGEQIFLKLGALQKLMSKRLIGIPGSRFVPSKNNFEIRKLEKEIKEMILTVVKKRVSEDSDEKDLLRMILEGAKVYHRLENASLGLTHDDFIVDNCKSIYFAGHETTAITASWVLMLMAKHPDWQARVREEACGIYVTDADTLRSMKTLSMVIQEALRLYPPGVFVSRKALEDIRFKSIVVPKGVHIQIPISVLHQDTSLWGPDAGEFKPERFENGIIRACKLPQAYIPFGLGPRICLGQHLATTELKLILSLLLSKFSFSLSPTYRHSPAYKLVIEPEHGINLLVERI